ncbi:hypothetical protein CLJ1_4175 [Pseudomonas paraeruginosa]|nr:hypothetical protein CLJ1_4175 [Pseudomonas aeruginosa]
MGVLSEFSFCAVIDSSFTGRRPAMADSFPGRRCCARVV